MKVRLIYLCRTVAMFICCLTCHFSSAQSFLPLDENKYRSDAEALLKSSSDDSVRAMQYFYLADYYRFRDTLKFWENMRLGERLAKSSRTLQAMGSLYKSFYYGQFLDATRAGIAAQKCVDLLD